MIRRPITSEAATPAPASPARVWSNDLEAVGPVDRNEPAWKALGEVHVALSGNVHAALHLLGLDAAIRFIDRGPKGKPWPEPVWPVEERMGFLRVPTRSSRPTMFLLDRQAAQHFGLSIETLRGHWLARWGMVWAAYEEQAEWQVREARRREGRRPARGRCRG